MNHNLLHSWTSPHFCSFSLMRNRRFDEAKRVNEPKNQGRLHRTSVSSFSKTSSLTVTADLIRSLLHYVLPFLLDKKSKIRHKSKGERIKADIIGPNTQSGRFPAMSARPTRPTQSGFWRSQPRCPLLSLSFLTARSRPETLIAGPLIPRTRNAIS